MQTTTPKISTVELRDISTLKLWDKNPRSIKTERFEELKNRLQRQGQIKPLLVTQDGTVIGGNMRLRAMKDLGYTDVLVSVQDATTDKEIFDVALTDNEEFGYYEEEQLAELAMDLGLTELELQAYEISLGEPVSLTDLIDKFGPEEELEEDEVPEVDDSETFSKVGEVYQLGRHRLMCGSATEVSDVNQLMNGDTADLAFTDPPYGISIVNSGTVGGDKLAKVTQYSDVIGDDTIETAINSFPILRQYSKEQIIWGGNYYANHLENSSCWVVWDKNNTGNFADCELAWTSYEKSAKLYKQTWNGMIREGETGKRVHPTQKPIGLAQFCFKTFDCDTVLDVFGGSGSTLMACEQTNRTCYMMELDPKYCDVIRKRYANHIGEGESWQEATPAV